MSSDTTVFCVLKKKKCGFEDMGRIVFVSSVIVVLLCFILNIYT